MKKHVFAALAALASFGLSCDIAAALKAAGPRQTLVENASRPDSARLTSTPMPLATGVAVLPFATREPVGGVFNTFAYVQSLNASFARQGAPVYVISGLDGCCASFAENGGAKLGGGLTQLVQSIYTYNGNDLTEVFGFPIAPDGTTTSIGEWLTRHKPGNQSGAVVVPLRNGRSFVMWADSFTEGGGQSASSVRGTFVAQGGLPAGPERTIEFIHSGTQVPADGVQLADARLLLVFKADGANDILGRTRFFGRFMRPGGVLDGKQFLMGANNENLFGASMRAAALPNGNFVVTWVDDRSGNSVPLFRIFGPTGEALFFAQPFVTYTTAGGHLDVAALADGTFVVSGMVAEAAGTFALQAQHFTEVGQAIGPPLVLHRFANPDALGEQHIANAGYLLGQAPPTGGLFTASDPARVHVTWRVNRGGGRYDIHGQALTTAP